jgi:hypothetical protein
MYLPNCYNDNCPLLEHHQSIRVIHKVAQIGGYRALVLLKLWTRSEDETTTVDNGQNREPNYLVFSPKFLVRSGEFHPRFWISLTCICDDGFSYSSSFISSLVIISSCKSSQLVSSFEFCLLIDILKLGMQQDLEVKLGPKDRVTLWITLL